MVDGGLGSPVRVRLFEFWSSFGLGRLPARGARLVEGPFWLLFGSPAEAVPTSRQPACRAF